MFAEHSGSNREGWKFTYTGQQLEPYAVIKFAEYDKEEKAARNEIVRLLQDPLVAPDSKAVQNTKKEVQHCGMLREQCQVFVHEFKRQPEREYHLTIADVVFFGLV